jgi:CBS domain-containing protein
MKDNHSISIGQSMKRNVISIRADATVRDAVKLIIQNHIGTLPVVNAELKLIGLVTIENILSMVMPDFIYLIDHFSFVHNLGAVEERTPDEADLNRPISMIMGPPVSVPEGSSLLYAAASKRNYNLRDIPVVDSANHLIGIASSVDIGTALMNSWQIIN